MVSWFPWFMFHSTVLSELERVRKSHRYDVCNISRKNSYPTPARARVIIIIFINCGRAVDTARTQRPKPIIHNVVFRCFYHYTFYDLRISFRCFRDLLFGFAPSSFSAHARLILTEKKNFRFEKVRFAKT